MNAYPTFAPSCLEKDGSSRTLVQPKAQVEGYPAQSSLAHHRKNALQTRSSIFIESALSPAKYALFQVLGTVAVQRCWRSQPTLSCATSAKIGAFGGIIVTIFYLMLALTRHTSIGSTKDDSGETDDVQSPSDHWRRSLTLLLHETLYSALASAIGSTAYSRSGAYHVDIAVHIALGCAGPTLFLVALAAVVAASWCIMRAQKRALDWWAGY